MDATTGSKLRAARIEKGLSLEEISEDIHIRVAYLRALEENTHEQIPSRTQARGFLRSYAKYLDLDEKSFLPDIPKTSNISTQPDESDQIEPTVDDETISHRLIFKEIGQTLRQRRDILGLSPDDIEAHTHIPTHYVDFIESGEFDSFPSPAQARGMLQNYLQFLEFDPDEMMNRYAEALQIRLSARQEQPSSDESNIPQPRPVRKTPKVPQWVRMFLSPDLILISTVGIIIIGLTIWGIGRVTRTQSERAPQPTAPSLVEALLPTSTQIPTSTATPQSASNGDLLEVDDPEEPATPIPTVQVAAGASLEVFVIVRQRAYLRITADGEVTFDGRTNPGNNLTFSAKDEIRVLTGNAAALQVYFNDQDQGVLGIFGEVAELIFTKDGVIRPTKVPTQTPIATEQPSETPEPGPTEDVNLPPEPNTPVP